MQIEPTGASPQTPKQIGGHFTSQRGTSVATHHPLIAIAEWLARRFRYLLKLTGPNQLLTHKPIGIRALNKIYSIPNV